MFMIWYCVQVLSVRIDKNGRVRYAETTNKREFDFVASFFYMLF